VTDDGAPEEVVADAGSPVSPGGGEADGGKLEDGIALSLSGGGYRAMLFHLGSLWRLNELGYLPRLKRISSVSGGSITAATLGLHWASLGFDGGGVAQRFSEQLVVPIRALAGRTLDVGSVLRGIFTTATVADRVVAAYRQHLFDTATLQALPDDDGGPRFVINATNLQTGTLWRFSKPYMADYQVGMVRNPTVELAVAVAASSAFPPVLSPLRLTVDPASFDPASFDPTGPKELHEPPFTTDVVLSDGGVYDNLGLETTWKRYRTILVSDAGGQLQPAGDVKSDWARMSVRVGMVIDNQVRDLRKRQVVAGLLRGDRTGAYWGIRSRITEYGPPAGSLPCPPERTAALAAVPTRLAKLDPRQQERLINWGYAVTDAAIRRHHAPDAAPPDRFPYPHAGIG
jgi:NTE family protein